MYSTRHLFVASVASQFLEKSRRTKWNSFIEYSTVCYPYSINSGSHFSITLNGLKLAETEKMLLQCITPWMTEMYAFYRKI